MLESSQSVSGRAGEHAMTVSHLSGSMEAMTASVIQNAENARATSTAAGKAAAEAREGGNAVAETVRAMKNITEKMDIIEDIARVLELAGLAELVGGGPVTLVPQARPGGWFPGAGSPPWQLDGVLSWLGQRQNLMAGEVGGGPVAVVLPTAPAGGPVPAKGWAWEDVMARHGAEPASDHFRHPRSFRAEPALPAPRIASQIPVAQVPPVRGSRA